MTISRPQGGRERRTRSWWAVLAIVWVAAAAYVAPRLDQGWVAHDEGTLGQPAERVLQGELPHRDFGEAYTGGLTYVNAAAFRLLGINVLSLRVPLFLVFLLWIPALYFVATRFVPPLGAGLVVALAAAWSLPNYAAPLPSWYNLFFATFGAAAVLRYLETDRARWLVIAGVCGGLSILVKVVGVFFVAAVLLFLVYRERITTPETTSGATRPDRWYGRVAAGALVAFVALLLWVVHGRFATRVLVHFVLPGAALAWFLVRTEWRSPAGDARRRIAALARLVAPFAAGVALPLAAFLAPYVASDSVSALLHGVFVAPMSRSQFAAMRLPKPETWVVVPVMIALLGVVPRWEAWLRGWWAGAVAAALLAVVALANNPPLYRPVFHSMRVLVPVVVLSGVWVLARRGDHIAPLRRQQLFLLLATAALCSLVQFPFSAPIYFFYVGPLAVLAGLALVTSLPSRPSVGPALLAGLYLLFAIVRVHPGFLAGMGNYWHRTDQTDRLALERGGVRVNPELAARPLPS
ncbi:MAG: hypothetical protein ACREN5_02075 [Gemmatimonadales bacterium]